VVTLPFLHPARAAMNALFSPDLWAAFLTLTALEIVLGIDNVIFLSIVAERVAPEHRDRVRRIGLALALLLRLLLLASISWLAGLTAPVLTLGGFALSWRDIVLGGGGLFLIYKGTTEIHTMVEGFDEGVARGPRLGVAAAIAQVVVLDVVFSLDSVITAVGMTDDLPVMIAAVVVAIVVMMVAAAPIGAFVNRHPTVKMLALGFLLLVGAALLADAGHVHIPRGYIYAAIAFSALIEALNMMVRRNAARRGGP
jgi:predicted tellurium resistance membrane protein TerC